HYVVCMNLIQAAWDADNVPRVLELLDEVRPAPGEEDLRNFEWHFWDRLCHAEKRVVPVAGFAAPPSEGPRGPKHSFAYRRTLFALSEDGSRFAWWRQPLEGEEQRTSVRIVDTATGKELTLCPVPDANSMIPERSKPTTPNSFIGWSGDLMLNRDGSRLVFWAYETTIVYDTTTGKEVARLTGKASVFSPDGKRLVLAVPDPAAKPEPPDPPGPKGQVPPPRPIRPIW